MLESAASMIGQISFWVKLTRKRSGGNPHAAFDVAGAGNVLKIKWRASSRPYQITIIRDLFSLNTGISLGIKLSTSIKFLNLNGNKSDIDINYLKN